MHYKEHMRHATDAARARHYLVIGPWDHEGTRNPVREFAGVKVGPESLLDLPLLHRQWYAWTMQGGPKPAFLRSHVAYYVMGADKWRYAESIEEVTERELKLYLHSTGNPTDVFSSGTLVADVPRASGPDHYVHDPRDVSLAALESTVDLENRADHRMVYASIGRRLVYHSAPFEADTEISGFFRLFVWLAIDQPDTDFTVGVYEVGVDGSAIQLTSDWLRARYRESEKVQKLIDTTEPLKYRFERFMFVSRLVRRAHRLRLVIGPLHSIYAQKNYNTGGVVTEESINDARCVTVKLFHDQQHPSALHVPLGRTSADD